MHEDKVGHEDLYPYPDEIGEAGCLVAQHLRGEDVPAGCLLHATWVVQGYAQGQCCHEDDDCNETRRATALSREEAANALDASDDPSRRRAIDWAGIVQALVPILLSLLQKRPATALLLAGLLWLFARPAPASEPPTLLCDTPAVQTCACTGCDQPASQPMYAFAPQPLTVRQMSPSVPVTYYTHPVPCAYRPLPVAPVYRPMFFTPPPPMPMYRPAPMARMGGACSS